MKKYNEYQLGFDRTQLWKEHESPMIRRQSALNAAQSFFANNNINYTATELKTLYTRFLNMIETGETNFFEGLDKWLIIKQENKVLEVENTSNNKGIESIKFTPPTK
jgi:hypothetical protein